MTNEDRKVIRQALENIDDFICGAPVDPCVARSSVKVVARKIEHDESPVDYELKIAAICNAIRELADAYGDNTLYNDYINKAMRGAINALHALEQELTE